MTPERWLHSLLLLDEPGVVGIARCADVVARHRIAESLVRDLASVHDLDPRRLDALEEAVTAFDGLRAASGDVAIVLPFATNVVAWGEWLQAERERLPEHVVALLVLLVSEDVPPFVTAAPYLWSWAKANMADLIDDGGDAIEVLDATRFAQEVGSTPEAFLAQWRAGSLEDTDENARRANLASALVGTTEER